MTSEEPVIGVVGPCAAGKTTLVSDLRSAGYVVRHIAQEHSYVQDMWKLISDPDYLVYLDVSFEVSTARSGSGWTRSIFSKQIDRLVHARSNADLYIQTDELTTKEVLEIVIAKIENL